MKFYMYMQEKVIGPYESEDIIKRFGGVSPETLVCYDEKYEAGSEKWHIIGQVPELARCIKNEISEPVAGVRAVPGQKLALQILSTDDDSNIRELLWNMLADVGHTVEFARDGEEVFKRLAEKKYDLVILDVNMPKMNGYKVSELMHKKLSNPPKVIIFTGRDLQKERLQFVCSGADSILSKGIDNDKLIRTIEGLFSRGPVRAANPVRAAFTPEPTPPGLAAPPVSKPPPPFPAVTPAGNVGVPFQKEGFFESAGREKSAPPAISAPQAAATVMIKAPPVSKAVEAPFAAPQPAAGAPAGGGPDIAEDQLDVKISPPAAADDINRLMGHIDLQCARLEMQFERQALKILETHQEAAGRLQEEWLSLRRFITRTVLLLAAGVLAALLIVTLR